MELFTLIMLYELAVHKPLAKALMNWIEFYNEIIVISCTLLLIAFADYGPYDGEGETPKPVRESVGWAYIALASSIIGVTLLAIFYEIIKYLLAKYRAWRLKSQQDPPKTETQKKYAIQVINAKDDCKLEDIADEQQPQRRRKHDKTNLPLYNNNNNNFAEEEDKSFG